MVISRMLRLFLSYLKTAGLAMAAFAVLAGFYTAVRLGSERWSVAAHVTQALLAVALALLGEHLWTRRWRRGPLLELRHLDTLRVRDTSTSFLVQPSALERAVSGLAAWWRRPLASGTARPHPRAR